MLISAVWQENLMGFFSQKWFQSSMFPLWDKCITGQERLWSNCIKAQAEMSLFLPCFSSFFLHEVACFKFDNEDYLFFFFSPPLIFFPLSDAFVFCFEPWVPYQLWHAVLFVSIPGLEFLEPAQVIDTNTLHSSQPWEQSHTDQGVNSIRLRRSSRVINCLKGMVYDANKDLCLGNY